MIRVTWIARVRIAWGTRIARILGVLIAASVLIAPCIMLIVGVVS